MRERERERERTKVKMMEIKVKRRKRCDESERERERERERFFLGMYLHIVRLKAKNRSHSIQRSISPNPTDVINIKCFALFMANHIVCLFVLTQYSFEDFKTPLTSADEHSNISSSYNDNC